MPHPPAAVDPNALGPLAERYVRRVVAVPGEELRAHQAGQVLLSLPAPVASGVVGLCVRWARHKPAAADALAALTRALARGEVDAEFVATCLDHARSRADRLAEAVFAQGPAARTYDRNDERFVDRKMRRLTLGERRALSRSRDIDMLVRLAHDQDPRVVRELLVNPRLTEREAVMVASRRPTHAHVLEAVLASRFGTSRRVRRAVAHNPYSPVALAMRAIAPLSAPELRLVIEDPHVSEEVRRHARSLLVGRSVTPAERDAAPAPPPDEDVDPEVEDFTRRLAAELGPGLDADAVEVLSPDD